jgi:hypothetical protein
VAAFLSSSPQPAAAADATTSTATNAMRFIANPLC